MAQIIKAKYRKIKEEVEYRLHPLRRVSFRVWDLRVGRKIIGSWAPIPWVE